jgi:hypothetical protein
MLAIVWGLFQLGFPAGFGFGAGWETIAIAKELVRNGVYGNPFHAGASGPTAVIAPLYPLYLADLMKYWATRRHSPGPPISQRFWPRPFTLRCCHGCR